MPHTSEGIRFPSGGFAKIPGGELKWQCCRDLNSSSSSSISLLQGLPSFKEFLQKQDEAMSLFIEGLLSTLQRNDSFDSSYTNHSYNAPHNIHNTVIGRGAHDEAIEAFLLDEGVKIVPSSPRTPNSPEPPDPLTEVALEATPSFKAPVQKEDSFAFSLGDVKADLSLKKEGIHLGNSFRSRQRVGLCQKLIYGFETWSAWYVNLTEPPRTSKFAVALHSPAFAFISVTVIIVNTWLIAMSADHDMEKLSDSPLEAVALMEWFFLVFYTMEVLAKVHVHRMYFVANDDMWWNLFDVIIVIISALALLPTTGRSKNVGFLRTFRVLRAARALRMFRVVSFFRDLRVMLDCIAGSFVALFWCLVLLVLIMFIFAVFFVQSLAGYLIENDVSSTEHDEIQERFGSVSHALLTLYEIGMGMIDGDDIFEMLRPTGWLNSALLLVLVGFYQIALFNILTGIFVESAMQSVKPERDEEIMAQRRQTMMKVADLKNICEELNLSRPGIVTREEFMKAIHDPNLRFAFETEGLHISDGRAFFDLLLSISNEDYVDIDTFVASCMRLRGQATSIDLQQLEFEMKKCIKEVKMQMDSQMRDGFRQVEVMLSRSKNKETQAKEGESGEENMTRSTV